MPTYEHKCFADSCGYEWDQVYGMTVDPPTKCPCCGINGKVKRLISLGSGPSIIRRSANEIKSGMKNEIRSMRERAKTDENFRANLVGDEKYNERVKKTEELTRELESIGRNATKIKSTDVQSSVKNTNVKPSATRPKIKTKQGTKT